MPRSYLRFIASVALLSLVGCGPDESRWEQAQEQSEREPAAVSEAALPGSTFNKFFPKQGDDIDIVFLQEKDGFAQASLRRGGEEIAKLSISDTRNNPSARDKFENAAEQIAGYPAAAIDSTTQVLVADRFQVSVQANGDAMTADDRSDWIEQFDLSGLAGAF